MSIRSLVAFPLFLLPVLLLPASAGAQERKTEVPARDVPHKPIEVTGNGFTLPEGEITTEELIEAAARFLNRNLLWNAPEINQNNSSFYFQRPLTLDALGCEEVLYSLLYQKGFAVLPLDADKQIFEVISLSGPRGREVATRAPWRTPDEIMKRPSFKEYVVTTLPLQHINATIATNALRPFFASTGGQGTGSLVIGNVGNNTAMLLQGFRDQIAAAIRILRECDTPQKERDLESYQLGQAVQTMQATVTELQAQTKRLQEQISELQKSAAKR
jgi:hypothetical protein